MAAMSNRGGIMAFPVEAYDQVIAELRATVADRDSKGRNKTNDFYSQFPHGHSDLTFELHRRVQRILGAEAIGDLETVYGDALDLANYSLFLLMMLNRKKAAAEPVQANNSAIMLHLTPLCDSAIIRSSKEEQGYKVIIQESAC